MTKYYGHCPDEKIDVNVTNILSSELQVVKSRLKLKQTETFNSLSNGNVSKAFISSDIYEMIE